MIYFDNAATSRFKPDSMIDSMIKELKRSSNPGRSAHNDAICLSSRIYEVRNLLKSTLHAGDDTEVIFTKNTTEALNIAILGYIKTFRYRIHIITTMFEHNSVLRPLKHLAKRGLVEVTILPIENDNVNAGDIEMHIRNNTRLIIMNHMSNVTGAVQDIRTASEIARAYNIPLLVDGAQSIGHEDISLLDTPITMLAGAGHKGLYGPEGTGFLLVNRREISLAPLTYGGTGTNSNILDMDVEYPESFEVGTLNGPAIIGLGESIKWLNANKSIVNKHIEELSYLLYTYLRNNPHITLYSPSPSCVLSFNVLDYSSEELATYLNEKNIAVRSGLHCAPLVHGHYGTMERGMVRVSIGYNNSIGDVDMLISALDQIK